MITGNPGHLKTFDYTGLHRYSLTFCTDGRRRVFTSHEVVDLVVEQFRRTEREEQLAIVAYCFMPDHVHLLAEGQSVCADGRRFIARAKQYSGFYYSKRYGQRLWQRYGFEHVLRDDESTVVVARYILENPLRAGLASRIEDYPYVGSMVYSLRELLDSVG